MINGFPLRGEVGCLPQQPQPPPEKAAPGTQLVPSWDGWGGKLEGTLNGSVLFNTNVYGELTVAHEDPLAR